MEKKKVLIIDDEEDVAQLTAKLLEKSGYESHCHFDGEGAFELIKDIRPDVILLDIRLPHISGIELFKKIRVEEGIKNTPVIFFSASATDRDLCIAKLGAESYVEKPFELESLLEEIKRVMEDYPEKKQ